MADQFEMAISIFITHKVEGGHLSVQKHFPLKADTLSELVLALSRCETVLLALAEELKP